MVNAGGLLYNAIWARWPTSVSMILDRRPPGRGDRRHDGPTSTAGTPGKRTLTEAIAPPAPGRSPSPDVARARVQLAADAGTQGSGGALPYRDAIQRSFGRHDVSQIRAHSGADAEAAAGAIGAAAFATGHHVVFAGTPSLHTAAHEAAHVVQQRAGVHLLGGVGQAGDAYEQHADAVADRVVRGESSEDLLDVHAGTGAAAGGAVIQLLPSTFSARLASDPLFNLPLLKQVTQSAWNAYVIQVKQYFQVEDDDEHRQRAAFMTTYQRATKLYSDCQEEFTEAQKVLAAEIQTMLETERRQLFGGGAVAMTDPSVAVPDSELTTKDEHGPFKSRFDRDDPGAWPVFAGTPTIQQVQQGNLGDCYLMAAIASIVHTNPQHFFDHILDRLDSRVTVKLYDHTGAAVNVTVEKSVVGDHCAHGSLWVALLEKAYVAAGFKGSRGKETQDPSKSYAAIAGGDASTAMAHLTGQKTGGLAIGAERAAVSEKVTTELRAETRRIEDAMRELDLVIKTKKEQSKDTTAEDQQMNQLLEDLSKLQTPQGELFSTLTLHYVSRDSIATFLARHADKPLFVAAVKRATSLDAEQGVLPGVLGSGKYGKDEIRLFEVIKQQVD
ncbi:MAG TPA: DUF4157 domain-containing protein, partial [Kofleriaceae bacterium]